MHSGAPKEVFVPVLIHQVVEYLLPFEGVLVGDAGERARLLLYLYGN